jgi:hypothetical protein
LHEALGGVGSPNRLHTIAGGGHGNFDQEQLSAAYAAIRAFLEENMKLPAGSATGSAP